MLKELIFNIKEKNIYHDVIESLVATLEAKDSYTSGHSERVSYMACDLSEKLGLSMICRKNIHIAAHLHDIGKIGVPDKVLNKSGKLSEEEWGYMKKHPQIGFDILSKAKKLKDISNIVLYHHERWDGKGYPYGLKEKDIPIGSRVIAVCDSIDAMTSNRPYREAMSLEQCFEELFKNKGKMYDPQIIEYIEKNKDIIEKFFKRYS